MHEWLASKGLYAIVDSDRMYRLFSHVKIKRLDLCKWGLWSSFLAYADRHDKLVRKIGTASSDVGLVKGPYAIGWQNLFDSTKNLNKNCLRPIFNLVIALKNFFFRSCSANCKICIVFTPDRNFSGSEAGRRRLSSLVRLENIWWEKNHRAPLYHGNDDRFLRKMNKNLPRA